MTEQTTSPAEPEPERPDDSVSPTDDTLSGDGKSEGAISPGESAAAEARELEIQELRSEIYTLQSKAYELLSRLDILDPPAPYIPPSFYDPPSEPGIPASESSVEPYGYPPAPPPPPFKRSDPSAARMRELADFVDELVRYHDFQQNILHCWPRHPEVVEELDFLLQAKEGWRYDPANLLYWRQYYVERCAERVKRFLRRCRAVHTDRASTWATDDYRAAVAAQIEELQTAESTTVEEPRTAGSTTVEEPRTAGSTSPPEAPEPSESAEG